MRAAVLHEDARNGYGAGLADETDVLDNSDWMDIRSRRATMIKYRNELKIRVSTGRGSVQTSKLKSATTALDEEIITCAGKCLKGQRLVAFFYAYHCCRSWTEIHDHFWDDLESNIDVETVQRYARDAADRIVDQISKT
jgi:hypothetical protein